jgi:hypothetical protein
MEGFGQGTAGGSKPTIPLGPKFWPRARSNAMQSENFRNPVVASPFDVRSVARQRRVAPENVEGQRGRVAGRGPSLATPGQANGKGRSKSVGIHSRIIATGSQDRVERLTVEDAMKAAFLWPAWSVRRTHANSMRAPTKLDKGIRAAPVENAGRSELALVKRRADRPARSLILSIAASTLK